MHEPFDPYWLWLAIPPAEQPPDHYRLLGLRRFEGDTQLIAGAAQSRIDHVRSSHDGRHPESVERVIEHLAAARDTLLNPTLKAQYDHLISLKQPAQAASASRPTPSPAPTPATSQRHPTAARPKHQAAAPAVNVVAQPKRRSNGAGPSLASLIVCGASATLALALGLALWLTPGDGPAQARSSQVNGRRQVASGPVQQGTSSSRPPRNAPDDGRGDRAGGGDDRGQSPGPARRPRGPETMADLMGPPDQTPADADTVTGELGAARRAMWSRDLVAARRHVDAALRQVQTSAERDETERLGKLLESLEAFWAAVRQGLARLEGAEELRLGNRRVLVVEADRQRLIVRDAGRNVTYTIQQLPQQLAVALAMQSLPRGQPTTNLHLGSFLAIDQRGKRHEARSRWEQAGAEGKALLPELTLAPPPEPVEPEQPAPSPVLLADGADDAVPQGPSPTTVEAPPLAAPAVDRAPIPGAGAQGQAEALVRELFQDDIDSARTAEAKKALSARLFDVACQTDDDPAACYVLCRIARDLAVEVGDPDSFCPVIDELDRRYQVDALAMKAEAFSEAWRSPNAAPYRPALARQSLNLLQAAIQAKRYAAAEQFLRVAQYGARAAKDYQLMRQLEERARQINALQRNGQ